MSSSLSSSRPIHFMGIGGAGMSALAELFVMRGDQVTGCDAAESSALDDLRRLGIGIQIGHDPRHAEEARAIVVTSAVPKDHPELVRARSLGIPVIRRAEALGDAVSGGDVVGIAGTHGKTTTTVMTTLALAAASRAPIGIAGGRVAAWNGNLYVDPVWRDRSSAERPVFVVEADEYDRSFLALTPTIAVVTNMEADHLDIYTDIEDIRRTFEQYVSPARAIVVCADDDGAASLSLPLGADVLRYGLLSPDARVRAEHLRSDTSGQHFTLMYDGDAIAEVHLAVPGLHNVRNALAALSAGIALRANIPAMAAGLATFTGVERRFQHIGEHRTITIIDDYAHHPTEVAATLQAARTMFPGRRIVAAFQPHLYTRTRDFAGAFGDALAAADVVLIADIYPAREQAIPGVSAQLVSDAVIRAGQTVHWQGPRTDLASHLAAMVTEGDVVLTMGAGDITKTGPELLQKLSQLHSPPPSWSASA